MKEFTGTARNYSFIPKGEKGFQPACELIIVVSEPVYYLTVDDMLRERKTTTYRIGMTRVGAMSLVKTLTEITRELEDMEAIAKQITPAEEEP